jgi:hypothetical protein
MFAKETKFQLSYSIVNLNNCSPNGERNKEKVKSTSCPLTDFELTLDATFASLTVVGLRAVVFRHDLDEFAGQCRMLRFAYPQISRRFVRLFFMFDVLFDYWNQQQDK